MQEVIINFGNITINRDSSCPIVHVVPAETTNSQLLFDQSLQQENSSSSTL